MSSVPFDRRYLMTLLAATSATCLTVGLPSDTILSAGEGGLESGGGNLQLQAIGSLGVGHIQSCLGFIGVIADSISKGTYTQKQIEDLMQGTVNGLELPKKMLRRLQDANISEEDKEFLDRMISVFNALQREANSVSVYAKSRKLDDAQKFERDRRLVLKKLADLTQRDDLTQPESTSRNYQTPRPSPAPRTVPEIPRSSSASRDGFNN